MATVNCNVQRSSVSVRRLGDGRLEEISRNGHKIFQFKPYPSSQKRCTRCLTSDTFKAVETSGYDFTPSGWFLGFSRIC
ncbi:unnamed protein product [Ixodes pacificus]